MRLALAFPGIKRRALLCLLRNLLDDRGEIMPEAERDEQFRHHECRSEQQMRRVVQQRRLSAFEHLMSDSLHGEADDNQDAGNRPHGGSARMAHDRRCGYQQQHGSAEDGCSERGIEQQPVDQDRHNRNRRRGGLDAKWNMDRLDIAIFSAAKAFR